MQQYSANMAFLSDVAMGVLGGELKRRERVSARLGDILSYLYLASCVLKRFDDEGRRSEDLPLMHWAMQDCMFKLGIATEELLNNFPNKLLGKCLKLVIMPFGKRFEKPSDSLDHAIAVILQTPGDARARLGKGQFMSREAGMLMGDLEQTLENVIACEPLFNKVCKAAKERFSFTNLDVIADTGLELDVLTEAQAELLRACEAGRLRAINVDDFDPSELAHSPIQVSPKPKAAAKPKLPVSPSPKPKAAAKPKALVSTKAKAPTKPKSPVSPKPKAKPKAGQNTE
jgi:acyl-CoA dehydrogenase